MSTKIDHKGFTFNTPTGSFRGKHCVAVSINDSAVRVIDSKAPDAILCYTHAEWNAFLQGVRDGEFDLPANT